MKKKILKKIGETKTFCHSCQKNHYVSLIQKENNVIAKILCSDGDKEIIVSNDANIFKQMRQKVEYEENFIPPENHKFFLNQLYITDACNCSCPICYVAHDKKETFFMSVEEAVLRAKAAKQRKAKNVMLIGGEPTVHPKLIEIIKELRQLKMKIFVFTNGLELGKNKNLAVQLKKAGVYTIGLQFDSLDRTTLKKMRGTDYLDLKLKAIKNIQEANLRFGLICTVASYNENEIDGLIKWALNLHSLPNFFAFQVLAETGRFPENAKEEITREKIIRKVISSKCLPGAKIDNFWPIPFYQPLGLFAHPDCVANLLVIRKNNKLIFFDDIINLSGLFKDMRNTKLKYFSKFAVPFMIYLFLKNTKLKNWTKIFNYLLTFQNPGKKNNQMVVGAGGYVSKDFEDNQRISRCGGAILTEKGSISLCRYFNRGCRISC